MKIEPQTQDIEWQVDASITKSDRYAILSLAKKMGIDRPRRVSVAQLRPGFCRFIRVESVVVQNTHRRTWLNLRVRSRDWPECSRPPDGSSVEVAGRWIAASSDLVKMETWRINDGKWHVDVFLEPDVPYSDAELIVLAIRRGRLVNCQPKPTGPIKRSTDMPHLDADSISLILKIRNGVREYEVHTGELSGAILRVRIVDGNVELHSYGTWMASLYACALA